MKPDVYIVVDSYRGHINNTRILSVYSNREDAVEFIKNLDVVALANHGSTIKEDHIEAFMFKSEKIVVGRHFRETNIPNHKSIDMSVDHYIRIENFVLN